MLMTTRLAFLQQIQKSAISGYSHYTTGTIEIEKLPHLIKKFQNQYQINQTRQQAYTKRLKGYASAKFYCYAADNPQQETSVFWVLLFTEGKTPATETENLKNLKLKKERFEYSDYQLIQKPNNQGKQTFTFQLTMEAFDYYQNQIRKLVRNKNINELNHLIIHINKMPGFSALRKQRNQLKSTLKGETKKHLNPTDQQKVQTLTNYYHRQQSVDYVKNLTVFIKQMQLHNRSIKQQLKKYRENKSKLNEKVN